jgi:hypothetical protein
MGRIHGAEKARQAEPVEAAPRLFYYLLPTGPLGPATFTPPPNLDAHEQRRSQGSLRAEDCERAAPCYANMEPTPERSGDAHDRPTSIVG